MLQRSSVSMGKVKIQGVTTCMYLCMDICGIPYASVSLLLYFVINSFFLIFIIIINIIIPP
ncbi:hypothetical protein O3M35_013251 [Rhynocoris fuscipes]|uniref:Uncharacterized protein n=1 Tax=Rhynocoris fuscipes TaxID=488301 RepID=A0AAW1CDV7_9HEMI